MRLHNEKLNVKTCGLLVENVFTIKATAKAFSVLSSSLYSDKILAIVRELSCNAYDAHIAAGKPELPFEIKLPTSFDPTFYVKDVGTGLSDFDIQGGWFNEDTEEKVSDRDAKWATVEEAEKAGFKKVGGLYNTYFDSTKNDSNDFVGALGLGSKSPFSYASTFNVESRHEGTKRLYNAFIGEDSLPRITLTGEEKTDEPNGMTISLAVRNGDANRFLEAARKALMYFDHQPTVIGQSEFAPHTVKHTVKGTNWTVRETGYAAHMSGAYVIQGPVVYPIDRDMLQSHGLSSAGHTILGLDIDFVVPIGSVEIAASREALSYTKATITNLMAAVGVAAAEMRASIQTKFDECTTLWEAQMVFMSFSEYENKMRRIFDQLKTDKPFEYKGQEIGKHVALDLSTIKNTQLTLSYQASQSYRTPKTKTSRQWVPNHLSAWDFEVHTGTTVLVDNVFTNSHKIVSEYLKSRTALRGNKYVLVIKPVSKAAYSQKEIDCIIKQLNGATFQYMSTLPFTKTKSSYTYRARKSDEVVIWNGYPRNTGYKRNKIRRVYSRLCWTSGKADTFDKKTERFYVELERFTVVDKGRPFEYFDMFLERMKVIKILTERIEIIGLNEKQAKSVKYNKAWKNLFTYCNTAFTTMNNTGVLTNAVVSSHITNQIGTAINQHFLRDWQNLRVKIVDGQFKTTLDKIAAICESAKATNLVPQEIEGAANLLRHEMVDKVQAMSASLTQEFEKVMSANAMLRLVDWDKVGNNDIGMIVDYVNFVAKS